MNTIDRVINNTPLLEISETSRKKKMKEGEGGRKRRGGGGYK